MAMKIQAVTDPEKLRAFLQEVNFNYYSGPESS
jgi:hypothetical protein